MNDRLKLWHVTYKGHERVVVSQDKAGAIYHCFYQLRMLEEIDVPCEIFEADDIIATEITEHSEGGLSLYVWRCIEESNFEYELIMRLIEYLMQFLPAGGK